MDEDLAVQRVFLRDRVADRWVRDFDLLEWIQHHEDLVVYAFNEYMKTFGGSIFISGTAEAGRVIVHSDDVSYAPILDYDWHVLTTAGSLH